MIGFWRTTDEFGCLSNFSDHSFVVNKVLYHRGEHYYQSKKTTDPKIRKDIIDEPNPKKCKDIANSCDLIPIWEEIKFSVMLETLYYKVTQNRDVYQKLMETGDEEIIETSPIDPIWGWGEDKKGQNLLGKAWVIIREKIKNGKIII